MKIFTAKQFSEADTVTVKNQNISELDLMERAAGQVFQWMDSRLKGASVPIRIFCGVGNNGGDGLALGRMLMEKGYQVTFYIVNYSENRSKCFLINYDRIKKITNDWPKLLDAETEFPNIAAHDVIVDAIFGIGLNRPLSGWLKKLVQHLNASKAFTLSIDVPSGLFVDSATPDFDAVIYANTTLTFQAPKLVFFLPETGKFSQSVEVLPIGLDTAYLASTPTEATLITKQDVLAMYVSREKFAHKGTYGHTLVVGGSYGKIGAVVLAAKACLRAGAGKVTALVPKCGYTILQTALPEAMVLTDTSEKMLENFDVRISPDVVAMGIGMGTTDATVNGFLRFLKSQKKPMVLDADALNILAKNIEALALVPKKSVLTPHPGELERLIGTWKDDFDKLEKTKKLSKNNDLIVVIKGAHTLTVYQDAYFINSTGNPGMATAGSGDVLTGVISGLLSQGYDSLIAAVFGVYIHGSAGDLALEKTGYQSLLASDISNHLGLSFLELFENQTNANQEEGQ